MRILVNFSTMQYQKGNISVIVSFVIVAGIIGLVVYALMHKTMSSTETDEGQKALSTEQNTDTQQLKDTNTQTKKSMDTNKKILANFTPVTHTDTLQKIDLVVGTGDEVKPGATVSVHYTGAVAATGEIFQSSKDFGPNPVTFPLSGVIKGWTDGIPGMKIGGTRRLIIPAAQAYGANPPAGSGIPANADLVFDVELIAIK